MNLRNSFRMNVEHWLLARRARGFGLRYGAPKRIMVQSCWLNWSTVTSLPRPPAEAEIAP